uniref:Twin-arginine translocase TatA/TatE family subunit n=1 Tax=Roseihalotalea indica TaxID=2867963 RepID=A0AA49JFI8_9BACT|nr:twin-arginine translocase TatA/TatE family subunit [Tunicatimonas sp. TK19036]
MLFNFLMLDNISGWELFIILFTIYIFFGVKAIPKFYQSLRKALANFQDALHDVKKEFK